MRVLVNVQLDHSYLLPQKVIKKFKIHLEFARYMGTAWLHQEDERDRTTGFSDTSSSFITSDSFVLKIPLFCKRMDTINSVNSIKNCLF